MIRYKLSRIAQKDLVDIRDYCLEQGGTRAARKILVSLVNAFGRLQRILASVIAAKTLLKTGRSSFGQSITT